MNLFLCLYQNRLTEHLMVEGRNGSGPYVASSHISLTIIAGHLEPRTFKIGRMFSSLTTTSQGSMTLIPNVSTSFLYLKLLTSSHHPLLCALYSGNCRIMPWRGDVHMPVKLPLCLWLRLFRCQTFVFICPTPHTNIHGWVPLFDRLPINKHVKLGIKEVREVLFLQEYHRFLYDALG